MSNDTLRIKGTVTVIKNKGMADEKVICQDKPNLLTTVGLDYIHNAIYIDESASKVACSFVAVSSNASAPLVGDTTLAGEILAGAGNGLGRANATTNTHTPAAATSVIENVYNVIGGGATDVQKTGLFTDASTGTMVHENTFTPETLVDTDTLTVTWTITIS
jgi:hypothetical protein